jgi:phage terminase small subunit
MASAAKIKKSLLEQLKIKSADVDLYRSLIDDYCWLWKQEREMQSDIKTRGRTYTAVSAAGKDYEKENPSVKNALLYNRQMVAILAALGLSTETVVSPDAGKDTEKDSDERDL